MQQSSEVILGSQSPDSHKIMTLRIMHNRFIHAELLRHRLFAFSVASSRAIPYSKQRVQVLEDPVIPLKWIKEHTGMQGSEFFTDEEVVELQLVQDWLEGRDLMVALADRLESKKVTKQLLNRMIELWVSTRCVITSTEWDNFLMLRHPWTTSNEVAMEFKYEVDLSFAAEIHIQDLAIKMKKSMDQYKLQSLEVGQWHLPFIEPKDIESAYKHSGILGSMDRLVVDGPPGNLWSRYGQILSIPKVQDILRKVSAARCALPCGR